MRPLLALQGEVTLIQFASLMSAVFSCHLEEVLNISLVVSLVPVLLLEQVKGCGIS